MILLNDFFSITSLQSDTDASITYSIRFNADHQIYKAHFPVVPVTPGVCIVQIAVELLGEFIGRDLKVSNLKNAKFLKVISPFENIEAEYIITNISDTGDAVSAKVNVEHNGTVFAKLSFECKNA